MGVERSTPSLLERMGKSAAGLSGMAGTLPPDVVRFKAASLLHDGRLADCYYYLCCVCRDVMATMGSHASEQATIQYAARICLDADRDAQSVRANALEVRDAADMLLTEMAGR